MAGSEPAALPFGDAPTEGRGGGALHPWGAGRSSAGDRWAVRFRRAFRDEEQAAIAELERSPVERPGSGDDAESPGGEEPAKLRYRIDAVADLGGLARCTPREDAGLEQ